MYLLVLTPLVTETPDVGLSQASLGLEAALNYADDRSKRLEV